MKRLNMNRTYIGLIAIVGLAGLVPSSAFAQISLGTAQGFAALGGSTVTNTGTSAITGNVGVSPGSSVTGFPPGVVTGGSIHANDAVAGQAQTDLTTAYNAVAASPCNVDLSGQDLGGLTLTPGVYCYSTSAFLTGTLRLDFQGNPNASFLFKIGSTLTTASASGIVLLNNGGSNCPQNLFWQVGSSATLGTGSTFNGNILALSSITLTTGAGLSGRALARNGAVTLDTNSVSPCGPIIICPTITVNPPSLPNGVVGTPYNQIVTATGGAGPFTFSISAGNLPNGLLLNGATGAITGSPLAPGMFNFTVTATDPSGCTGSRAYQIIIAAIGCPAISLSPAVLPPGSIGVFYSQTMTASGGVAPYTFTVFAGALPTGLSLNSITGVISGSPQGSGLFSFTIQATDANGCPGRISGVSIGIAAIAAAGGPTLNIAGLTILTVLLAVAGLFVMKRFSI